MSLKTFATGVLCIAIVPLALGDGPVSIQTLLPQMTDMSWLTHRPHPFFKMAQASSYDRHSDPGPNQDWFANGDAGWFVREEQNGDRHEWVMADLKGPGAVVRLWSANPQGTVRFYFDGETVPRIEKPMDDLFSGRVAPFGPPFGYEASSGHDLYFPFPYATSLKITVDNSLKGNPKSLYYHVGYRTYGPETEVETFTWDRLSNAKQEMARAATLLKNPGMAIPHDILSTGEHVISVQGGTTARLSSLKGPGVVYDFRVKLPVDPKDAQRDWNDPDRIHTVLRTLNLNVIVDGNDVIRAPLGDFFGSAPGLNAFDEYPMQVEKSGVMTCRLPMPFRHQIEFRVENVSAQGRKLRCELLYEQQSVPADTYALHAQWGGERARTRPFRDMSYLQTRGEGMWIGSMLQVTNPVPAWWGEGDEKVFVDGESFPSTFGTGTEDYYGYAWSSPELFTKPYHAQTRCDPGAGQVSVNRFQLFDPIPYSSSLRFYLEMWHWADVTATYMHTVYWYAPSNQQPPEPINRALLLPVKVSPPEPVKGALEGEKLKILAHHGGTLEVQGGFWEISGQQQLWWRDVNPGDTITLDVPVKQAGTYEIIGNFCHAADYGIHKITINGKELAPIDFYSPSLGWKKTSLGKFDLPAGHVTFQVDCVGANPAAIPKRMFGLDYLLLNNLPSDKSPFEAKRNRGIVEMREAMRWPPT